MNSPTITEFENLIEQKRQEYFTSLTEILILLEETSNLEEIKKKYIELHNKGVAFFNLFERSIDEYGLQYFELNKDTKNRKIEDAISIIDVILNHWITLNKISKIYSVSIPIPSKTAYSSIQRFIKHFHKNKVVELKNKFMKNNLPTNGFDDNATFSGWEIGSKNLTIAQIIFGVLFISLSGIIIFNKETLNGMQYFFSRAILSLGLTLIGSALLEGTVKLNWTINKSLTIKAVGWVSLFIMLYYFNPPSAPIP